MSPRPRFTSKIDSVRNAVLVSCWFLPMVFAATQFAIGFGFLTISTTLLLIQWPFSLVRTIVVLSLPARRILSSGASSNIAPRMSICWSPARAFALVGSAILFEAILMRLGFVVADAIASQSTRAPLTTRPFGVSLFRLPPLLCSDDAARSSA
jgi:hypothetical protein